MACFLVSMGAAIVITVFKKKIPEKYHINWLSLLLWGGVIALALEHIAHEEIVPYFPFLSAMSDPADTTVMLSEMATVGTAMLLACIAIWVVMVVIYNRYSLKMVTSQVA